MSSTGQLQLELVEIFAEVGHISTYCTSNYALLKEGMTTKCVLTRNTSGSLDTCAHRAPTMKLPSLDKMIRLRNENLTIVTTNERDDLLTEQSK